MKTIFYNKLLIISLITIATFLISCDNSTFSKAKGEISNFEVKDDIFLSDGLDYGAKISFNLKNTGESGEIKVNVKLSCSEGVWKRQQILHLKSGEIRKVSFIFKEPSIDATNIEGMANVSP